MSFGEMIRILLSVILLALFAIWMTLAFIVGPMAKNYKECGSVFLCQK